MCVYLNKYRFNNAKSTLLNIAEFTCNLPLHDWMCSTVVCAQVPDNYTPPAPITAPVMGFPMEAPQPHDHAQVPPGAPQEPSVQVGV